MRAGFNGLDGRTEVGKAKGDRTEIDGSESSKDAAEETGVQGMVDPRLHKKEKAGTQEI